MNVIPYKRAMKRKRAAPMRLRVSRPLRYNGEIKITRVCNFAFLFNNGGFVVNNVGSSLINMNFDPANVNVNAVASTATTAIPGASELAALYDLMRIDKVEIIWNASVTGAGAAAPTAPPGCPKFLVAFDPNEGSASSMDQLRQQNPKEYYAIDGRSHKFTCKPKFQRIVYQTALVSNYEAATGFVNTDSTIPHYGVKIGIPNAGNLAANQGGNVEFCVRMFYTLKNVK